MLLPGCHIPRTYLFLTVLVTAIIANPEDDKTFNLRIGFDLTHGENGAPALRIRDFEDSNEFNPRAKEVDPKKSKETDVVGKAADVIVVPEKALKKAILRSGKSTSSESESDNDDRKERHRSSEEDKQKPKVAAAAADKESDQSESRADSEEDVRRSTRGLGNVEPEDQYPKRHGRAENDDDDDRRRRRKRSPEERLHNRQVAEKFIKYYSEKLRRKSKKVNKMPKEARSTSYKPF